MSERLIQWKEISVLITGGRAAALAAERALAFGIEGLRLRFGPGVVHVEGTLRKRFRVPFSLDLVEPIVSGLSVSLAITNASVLGFIPIPKLLLWFAESFVAEEGIVLDAASSRLRISLVRFLPSFVDVRLAGMSFVAEGLAIQLAEGGADLPTGLGGDDGSHR